LLLLLLFFLQLVANLLAILVFSLFSNKLIVVVVSPTACALWLTDTCCNFSSFCCLLAATLHMLIVASVSPSYLCNCFFSFSHRLFFWPLAPLSTDACTATVGCCCCSSFCTSACVILPPSATYLNFPSFSYRLIAVIILLLAPFGRSACATVQHSSPPSCSIFCSAACLQLLCHTY